MIRNIHIERGIIVKKTPLENWIINKTKIHGNRLSLEEYQLNKIKETIQYVKENSSFYREKFKDIAIEDINTIKDIQELPFTTSEDIGKDPYKFLCIPQKEIKRIVTLNTSGTTGKEKRIFFSSEDIDSIIDFFEHGMKSLVHSDDRLLVLLPGDTFGSIGDLLKKAVKNCTKFCVVMGVLNDVEEVTKTIIQENINCIVGIPLQILYLARTKTEIFKKNIVKVLLSTDYVPKVLVDELNNKYDCKVFNHYGMTEMGYGGGVQCEALRGYHMREVDLYFEIIDPVTGNILLDGEYGEIVFTTLTRRAMPLIRYRTGDISRFIKEKCPCGSFLKSMELLEGRMDNRVMLEDNKWLYLKELDEILLQYTCVLNYKAYMDIDKILVIEIFTNDEEEFNKIKDEIKNKIGKLVFNKLGYVINIQLIRKYDDEIFKVKNSMVKRKILDHRKEGGK